MQRPYENDGDALRERQTIDLLEEQIEVSKRATVSGRVRVSSVTDLVEEQVRETLAGQTIEVVHVPIDRFVDTIPEVRTDGDVTIMPVVEEVLVVEKRLRLKEELHIRIVRTEDAVSIPVTLRKQRAVVERLEPETGPMEEELNNGL